MPSRTLMAVAVNGRHHVRLRSTPAAERSASSVLSMLTAKLAQGRWTVVVSFKPANGYAAPKPSVLEVTVPAYAR